MEKSAKTKDWGSCLWNNKKDKGAGVEGDCLGIIVNVNPTYIVQGDFAKGTMAMKKFEENPKYIRTEYQYVDF